YRTVWLRIDLDTFGFFDFPEHHVPAVLRLIVASGYGDPLDL
ncbi:hypothetical protein Pgy4_34131, partial [Pseudomonas savastanoi pv. glycinea str. race 4]